MSGGYRIVLLVLAMALLSGCGAVGKVKNLLGIGEPLADLRKLSVAADPGANHGSATQLDIVLVYERNAIASLPKSGPDWFRQRAALHSSLAKQIEVVSLQVPGASAAFKVKLPKRVKKSVAVIAFANYVAPEGWPPITLTPYSKVALQLQAKSIAIVGK